MNDVYLKKVKGFKYRRGVTQRWIARDEGKGLVGIGKTRTDAVAAMRPESQITAGSFDHAFLAAIPLAWSHRSEL